MPGIASHRVAVLPLYPGHLDARPRSVDKRARIVEAALQQFGEKGYHPVRVGDIAASLGIAKGSIFQHFGSKDGLFLQVYKQAVRSFPKYLDVPRETLALGFFEVLRGGMIRTEQRLRHDWIPYRVALLGNHGTDLALKREINRFLVAEDPYGTVNFVRFGLARHELRRDMDLEMIVSILDWMMERFQDALLTAELDSGLFRRQSEAAEDKEARIRQFLDVLRRSIGAAAPRPAPVIVHRRGASIAGKITKTPANIRR